MAMNIGDGTYGSYWHMTADGVCQPDVRFREATNVA